MHVLPPFSISEKLVSQLSEQASNLHIAKQLNSELLKIIYQQKWFKLFVPEQYGGLQLSLPDGLNIEEDLARIDGSLGWTVTLCSGASLFAGYLPAAVNKTVFSNDKVCFGGSGRANGVAIVNENGYEVTGSWPYATGVPHCTIFTANCYLVQDGKQLQNADGTNVIHSFFFLRNEVHITPHWDMMGLKATAGHSFYVDKLQVPAERKFLIDSSHATLPHPVYTYPFLQFAEATLAVNTLGMGLHFLSLNEQIFQQKKQSSYYLLLMERLTDATEKMLHLRNNFYKAVSHSWQSYVHNSDDKLHLPEVSLQSRLLANGVRNLIDELFPYCGLTAATATSAINKVWLDIHTASQHSLLLFPTN